MKESAAIVTGVTDSSCLKNLKTVPAFRALPVILVFLRDFIALCVIGLTEKAR